MAGGSRINLVWDVTAKSIGHILKATDAPTDLEGRFLSKENLDHIGMTWKRQPDVASKLLVHLFVKPDFTNGQCSDELHGSITPLETVALNNAQDDVSHRRAVRFMGAVIKLSGQRSSEERPLNDPVVVAREYLGGEQYLLKFTRLQSLRLIDFGTFPGVLQDPHNRQENISTRGHGDIVSSADKREAFCKLHLTRLVAARPERSLGKPISSSLIESLDTRFYNIRYAFFSK